MRILLTNDDGFHAPGIEALHTALTEPEAPLADEVFTVAPLEVQSATSHGVTFHTPLMVSQERVSPRMAGLAVDGRPADCVKLAITSLWPQRFGPGTRPDLVLSGLNSGANVGINVIYSGTVAAALEAAFLGVPAIALSLHIGRGVPDYLRAARIARRAVERILRWRPDRATDPLPPHTCLSVNIPICEEGAGRVGPEPADPPMRVCPMNTHGLIDSYERRVSPDGRDYYWATGHGLDFHGADEGTDVDALFKGCISVTPLYYDLTKHSALEHWKHRLEG